MCANWIVSQELSDSNYLISKRSTPCEPNVKEHYNALLQFHDPEVSRWLLQKCSNHSICKQSNAQAKNDFGAWCNTCDPAISSITLYYIHALHLNTCTSTYISIVNVIIIVIIIHKTSRRERKRNKAKQMGISWDSNCQQRIAENTIKSFSHLAVCTIDHHLWWPITCSDKSICWFFINLSLFGCCCCPAIFG